VLVFCSGVGADGDGKGEGCRKVPSGGFAGDGLMGDGLASFIYGPGSEGCCDAAGGSGPAAAHDAHGAAPPPPSQAGPAQPPAAQLPPAHDGQSGAKQADVGQVEQAAHAEQAGAAQQAGPQAGTTGA